MSENPVISEVVEGDGWTAGHLAALGEGWGFRKVRVPLGVTSMGVNALVLPPRYQAGFHYHDEQEEIYFVHAGDVELEFGDGSVAPPDDGDPWIAPPGDAPPHAATQIASAMTADPAQRRFTILTLSTTQDSHETPRGAGSFRSSPPGRAMATRT